jgi:hypothetical protein
LQLFQAVPTISKASECEMETKLKTDQVPSMHQRLLLIIKRQVYQRLIQGTLTKCQHSLKVVLKAMMSMKKILRRSIMNAFRSINLNPGHTLAERKWN